MIVIVLTVSPPKLRGHLTRWLFEISPGVYVGKVSARVRELLWEQVHENIGVGRAIMTYSSNNEQGLEFKTIGQEWEPVDFDGLELIMRPDSAGKAEASASDPGAHRDANSKSRARRGWSNAARYRKYGR
jgi:CRISPR-associated protein Cas2